MSKKVRDLIKKNQRILKSIRPSEVRMVKHLRLFYHYTGHLSISMSVWGDNGTVLWNESISQRKDGFIHLADIEKARKRLERFEKQYEYKVKGIADVISEYRGKGLLVE